MKVELKVPLDYAGREAPPAHILLNNAKPILDARARFDITSRPHQKVRSINYGLYCIIEYESPPETRDKEPETRNQST